MTDDNFDALAREALASEWRTPNEAVWARIKPVRWSWLPTIPEIVLCGSMSATMLMAAGSWLKKSHERVHVPNPVIQIALHDEVRSVTSIVSRIPGAKT